MLLGTIIEEGVIGILMESTPAPDESGTAEVEVGAGKWVIFSKSNLQLDNSETQTDVSNSASGEESHRGESQGVDLQSGGIENQTISSLKELEAWLGTLVPAAARLVLERLHSGWAAATWKDESRSMDEFPADNIENLLFNGIGLQIAEAGLCLAAGGGPWLDMFRQHGDPFVPLAPRWDSPPDGVKKMNSRAAEPNQKGWRAVGEKVTWWEAWEVSRPWMKDMRIDMPQRLHHPDGWAAGEMDVVHRWRENAVIVDIKSSRGEGRDHSSLAAQIGFYDWLWRQTRPKSDQNSNQPDGELDKPSEIVRSMDNGLNQNSEFIAGRSSQTVERLAGWYLKDCYRHDVEALTDETLEEMTAEFIAIRDKMLESDSDAWGWLDDEPVSSAHPLHCPHCSGRSFCAWTTELGARPLREFAPLLDEALREKHRGGDSRTGVASVAGIASPMITAIADLPRRVAVRGTLSNWFENQDPWGETIRVASIRSGTTMVVIEEAEPGIIDESWAGEVVLTGVAPGAFRGKAKLFVDSESKVRPLAVAGSDIDVTRLGLLPTKASVAGRVISRGGMKGTSKSGRPWSFESLHLWDGSGILEVVAFGRNRTRTFSETSVGDDMRLEHTSLSWRDGAPQVSIDASTTKITIL